MLRHEMLPALISLRHASPSCPPAQPTAAVLHEQHLRAHASQRLAIAAPSCSVASISNGSSRSPAPCHPSPFRP